MCRGSLFYQQKNFLKKNKISFKEISIETNGDPEENAYYIKKALNHPKSQKAIIITHSKGV